MPKYASRIVVAYPTPHRAKAIKNPNNPNLFRKQDAQILTREEQEKFDSTVIRVMFYAARVLFDILYS